MLALDKFYFNDTYTTFTRFLLRSNRHNFTCHIERSRDVEVSGLKQLHKKTMYITVTSIKLKHWWNFFKLSQYALAIVKQTKKEKGLIKFKKQGIGLLHYTLTAWESEEDLKRFARSGAHLEAMKISGSIASELGTYTYESRAIPNWKEAKILLQTKGKLMTFK